MAESNGSEPTIPEVLEITKPMARILQNYGAEGVRLAKLAMIPELAQVFRSQVTELLAGLPAGVEFVQEIGDAEIATRLARVLLFALNGYYAPVEAGVISTSDVEALTAHLASNPHTLDLALSSETIGLDQDDTRTKVRLLIQIGKREERGKDS